MGQLGDTSMHYYIPGGRPFSLRPLVKIRYRDPRKMATTSTGRDCIVVCSMLNDSRLKWPMLERLLLSYITWMINRVSPDWYPGFTPQEPISWMKSWTNFATINQSPRESNFRSPWGPEVPSRTDYSRNPSGKSGPAVDACYYDMRRRNAIDHRIITYPRYASCLVKPTSDWWAESRQASPHRYNAQRWIQTDQT